MNFQSVTVKAFSSIQNLNIAELAQCDESEIRPLLPCLVRMSLLPPIDSTNNWMASRKQLLSILSGIEIVNNIVSLLQVNFHELELDVKKEQQMRQKIGYAVQESAHYQSLTNGVVMDFERADILSKVRVVLSEIFYIQAQIVEQTSQTLVQKSLEANIKKSELFDNDIYLEEIADIICIALAELPSLLNVLEIVETLLYVNNGSKLICWVVANMPDCFRETVTALITNGDEDNPDGKLRLAALYELCDMNPGQALTTRTICVEQTKMPSLMLKLSLKDPENLVAFISGLLLGNDQNIRAYFALYVRSSQKRKGDALHLLRDELLKQLQNIVMFSQNSQLQERHVVQSAAMLRLYCALRGISGIKFTDEEIFYLIQLITTKPPPSPSGIRFVSLGLCMLIACPSLLANQGIDTKIIDWIQWLIKEEAYFEKASDTSASFGEMLLLMAIHFHSNQLTHICELACSTLGMKFPLRPNTISRMRHIFTQEIFTEQVVAAHAIRVPVTMNLNATISGYLPVHCIHQLLKSRAFSKHKVPIKNWIFKQICNSITPLHPVLPALIEAYVMSIILPNQKNSLEHTHKALSEQEIQQVFKGISFNNVQSINELNPNDDTDNSVAGLIGDGFNRNPNLTPQLLLLYYLLLYEDVRLSNMVNIISSGRQVKAYSTEFLFELPIKYLLQQAQKNQQEYNVLFSPLLRLLVTHFPHLSLVDDWIDEENISSEHLSRVTCNERNVIDALEEMNNNPVKTIKHLKVMMRKNPSEIWPMAEIFIRYFKKILCCNLPRLMQELYKNVWIRLNTINPRQLWIMTINALMPEDTVTRNQTSPQEIILIDPLQILRCDERIFRCASALFIVLRILQSTLAASKSQLSRHMLDKPLIEMGKQIKSDTDREELKLALIASQESVAVQILLEACLESKNDLIKPGRLWALREVRGMVCSYIHQVFIAEPSLAKLVHFQGYPRELLHMTVRGIPSMHICLDFIPELLSMAEMDKQIFAVDLTSHLSLQYALPKSLSVAKLCLNTLTTLLGDDVTFRLQQNSILWKSGQPSLRKFSLETRESKCFEQYYRVWFVLQ
ncbi:integrator complex subunit 2 isoform X2 [Wyeomyia smithii]|uniref:integrator complex subunit 2 isoform X2 n=1 Tax=Wyeomyia smithii TaxID=174621 RepID=UPI002467F243|nr:integrator complex subunit 2 isoform X2 [Wyeomyia smithii]